MYIIRTLHGDVKADYDEIQKIIENPDGGLVFLRNGAVNIKHITNIVPDTDRMNSILRLPGMSKEDTRKRIEDDRSTDNFERFRSPGLKGPEKLT